MATAWTREQRTTTEQSSTRATGCPPRWGGGFPDGKWEAVPQGACWASWPLKPREWRGALQDMLTVTLMPAAQPSVPRASALPSLRWDDSAHLSGLLCGQQWTCGPAFATMSMSPSRRALHTTLLLFMEHFTLSAHWGLTRAREAGTVIAPATIAHEDTRAQRGHTAGQGLESRANNLN